MKVRVMSSTEAGNGRTTDRRQAGHAARVAVILGAVILGAAILGAAIAVLGGCGLTEKRPASARAGDRDGDQVDGHAAQIDASEQRADAPRSDEQRAARAPGSHFDMSSFEKPSDAELRKRLDALEYKVTQQAGTEPPFNNRYWDNHAHGLYVDVVSGEPLFSSLDKFESGSGWPSFTRPVEEPNVVQRTDKSWLMQRTEVRSKHADSHLGHLFDDGPAPTGMRYCINSASLRFVPVERLEAEGYGAYLPAFVAAGVAPAASGTAGAESSSEASSAASSEASSAASDEATRAVATRAVATLAGGCFWGVEQLFRELDGVIDTRVGYTGGTTRNPTYQQVCSGRTGHAEAIEITFDPRRVSYEAILRYFYRLHDPTTPNRQHNDVGTQYRSAIFVHDAEQRRVAESVTREVDASGIFDRPVVTEIVDASTFYAAEDYHQDYLVKNPGGYMCHVLRPESSSSPAH